MANDWSWYALQVAPGREFQVVNYLTDDTTLELQGLSREDLHVILPVRHVLIRRQPRRATFRSRSRSLVARPRIPGYVLMGLQPHASPIWRVILSLPYVLSALGGVAGGEPQPVGDRQILIALLSDLQALARRRRKHKLKPVTIANGPYQGMLVGVIEVAEGEPEIYGVVS